MSAPGALLSGPARGQRSVARDRRVRDLLWPGLAGVAALAVALGVSVGTPKPNVLLACGLLLGAGLVVALMVIPRLEITVAGLALYLTLLDGPVKLMSANQAASAARDVLIAAVSLGALARLAARRERLRLPPLWGWVGAFVALVLIEALNPHTHGISKVLGGFRQNLEWIPFFFFGYALMRSHERFRKLFILLGVVALANGVVSAYQATLTPAQLASWGPGYSERVNGNFNGTTGTTGRKYVSEGVARVRPPGLGSDSGFGGGVGVIALSGALALIATGRRRRRWVGVVLCLGALLAVATCLGRLQVVGAVIALVCFLLLSLSAGRRVTRPLGAMLAVGALALPLGALVVSAEGSGVFSRYESIEPNQVVNTSTTYKEKSLAMIPHYVASDPFGFGLATAGPATSFGGRVTGELEGHSVTAETQYNFVVDELGLPGLILWVALAVYLIALVLRRLPRIADVDVRIDLAAVFAVVFAYTVMGLRGAFTDTSAAGPFFWFTVGIAAYWLAGPGRRAGAAGQADPSPTLVKG